MSYFFTKSIVPITIGINPNISLYPGTSPKIKKENTITRSGITGKLDIATKESSFVRAMTHEAFQRNKTRKPIRNIQRKFSWIFAISKGQTNTKANIVVIITINIFLLSRRKKGFAPYFTAFFVKKFQIVKIIHATIIIIAPRFTKLSHSYRTIIPPKNISIAPKSCFI